MGRALRRPVLLFVFFVVGSDVVFFLRLETNPAGRGQQRTVGHVCI